MGEKYMDLINISMVKKHICNIKENIRIIE